MPGVSGPHDVEIYLFIDSLASQAGDVAKEAGLPVSAMTACACLESGYGSTKRAQMYNAIFSITKNDSNPNYETRTSASPVDDIADDHAHAARIWVDFLLNHPDSSRGNAMRAAGTDLNRAARLLPWRFAFGPAHATAEQTEKYTQDLLNIIGRYNLTKYDSPLALDTDGNASGEDDGT